ncbi:carbon monoxide dehydrogenase [Kribbella capetownensis]|uniref:Carbon monoxide dehydrogenase n=1 Tax=Kribbella capetownensis TaxID=1572659 RepID=A0A4R0JY40_9ACTN|nr:SRPBCC family protein [Kribbella capetownensis]TCC50218.1 carbon monoxide dehydrogenase [Kribbella capetownensis]
MKLEHKFVVPAPVDEAWVAFNDLGRVVPCFPGATLTSTEGDEFTGSCKVKLGPVSLQYSGNGTFVERDESDHHAVIEAKGKDRRGNGTASVRVVARLTAADATSTQVTVDTDLTITGRPAQFGRGLIQEVSDRLLDQFTTCLTTTLQTPTTSTTPTSGATSAPSTTPATPSASAASTEPTAQAQPAGPAPAAEPAESADQTRVGAGSGSGELNLVASMLPVLARRVRPYLIGAVVALVLRRLFRR